MVFQSRYGPPVSTEIAQHLAIVVGERQRRAAEPALLDKVTALKAYQQRRFEHTYADLLQSERYGAASRFFLVELYGPTDFTRRDAQFARVGPTIARVFPEQIAGTILIIAELHALSEFLDTAMARELAGARFAPIDYVAAWQRVGRPDDRQRQVALAIEIARQLDRITRLPLLRSALRMMRAPARAAGLGELHRTLESGFETFRGMKGADEFIATIDARERSFASDLFAADGSEPATTKALAHLPPP